MGRIKFAPGTWGSIAIYPLYYFMAGGSETATEARISLYSMLILFCVIGFFAVMHLQKRMGKRDWSFIVIDEVIGILIPLAMNIGDVHLFGRFVRKFTDISLNDYNIFFLINLVIFRYFDIRKPLFIRKIDRMSNSVIAVILDDVLAGLYTAVIVWVMSAVLGKYAVGLNY